MVLDKTVCQEVDVLLKTKFVDMLVLEDAIEIVDESLA